MLLSAEKDISGQRCLLANLDHTGIPRLSSNQTKRRSALLNAFLRGMSMSRGVSRSQSWKALILPEHSGTTNSQSVNLKSVGG